MELVLADGILQEAEDVSEQVAQSRREILEGTRQDPDGPPGSTGWISRTFRLGYRRGMGE
jgi:hypothetical protein